MANLLPPNGKSLVDLSLCIGEKKSQEQNVFTLYNYSKTIKNQKQMAHLKFVGRDLYFCPICLDLYFNALIIYNLITLAKEKKFGTL